LTRLDDFRENIRRHQRDGLADTQQALDQYLQELASPAQASHSSATEPVSTTPSNNPSQTDSEHA
jgi:hypothetical protein